MGNRIKKAKRSPSNQKPQFTSEATGQANNPPRNIFSQIVTLYQKPPHLGRLWEKHVEIYRMLHSTETENDLRCSIYLDKIEKPLLDEATRYFSRVQYTHMHTPGTAYIQSSPPRLANLVARMDDAFASKTFSMIDGILGFPVVRVSLFGGGTGGLDQIFNEQLFIAFLEWLLKNNRPYFEMLEDHHPLKEYTEPASSSEDNQPAPPANQARLGSPQESLFHQHQRAQDFFTLGTFFKTHLDICQQLKQQNEKEYNRYKIFEMLAIKHLISLFHEFDHKEYSTPQPAPLVENTSDGNAPRVFVFIKGLLAMAGFQLSSAPDLKEQLVIGVLKWMLEHERGQFNDIETASINTGI